MAGVAAHRIRFMREGANPRRRVADFDTGTRRKAPKRGSRQRVAPSATRSRSINRV